MKVQFKFIQQFPLQRIFHFNYKKTVFEKFTNDQIYHGLHLKRFLRNLEFNY